MNEEETLFPPLSKAGPGEAEALGLPGTAPNPEALSSRPGGEGTHQPPPPAFTGDEAVPKSYIRKILVGVIESTDDGELKVKAAEALAKLENYTGPGSLGKRESMKLGVMIVQTSKHKIAPPKVSPGLARNKLP